jgi:hypothetical protein
MARRPTGQIIERSGARGHSFRLRFRAYGDRHYVTTEASTRQEAEVELQNILADVRRGIWRRPLASSPRLRRPSRRSTSLPRSGSRPVSSKGSPTRRSSTCAGRSSITYSPTRRLPPLGDHAAGDRPLQSCEGPQA